MDGIVMDDGTGRRRDGVLPLKIYNPCSRPSWEQQTNISWCEKQIGNLTQAFCKYRNRGGGSGCRAICRLSAVRAVAGDGALNVSRWVQSTTSETLSRGRRRLKRATSAGNCFFCFSIVSGKMRVGDKQGPNWCQSQKAPCLSLE